MGKSSHRAGWGVGKSPSSHRAGWEGCVRVVAELDWRVGKSSHGAGLEGR